MFWSLNYKWLDSTTNIFLWTSCFTTILLQLEEDHDIKSSQKQLELKLWWFQRPGSNFTGVSHRRFSIKEMFKNFAIFTGKHLCQDLVLIKVAGFRLLTLFKKGLWRRGFSGTFTKCLRTPFSIPPLDVCFSFKTIAGFILSNYM